MGYDDASQVTLIRHSKSDDTQVAKYEHSYNDAGVRTSVLEGNSDRVTWSYDSAWRLTREQRSGDNAYDITYSYDSVGSRATKVTGGVTTTYSYNAGDAVTGADAGGTLTTYSWDDAGNNTVVNANGSLTTYTWDGESRLATIQIASGTITLSYDTGGLRRSRQDASTTRKYVWDGQNLLVETDGDGTTVAEYTFPDPTGLEVAAVGGWVIADGRYGWNISQRRGATSRWYHGSVLGTVDVVTDASGGTTDTRVFDSWGLQVASSGTTTNPFRFIGALGYYAEPDAGLQYVGARWLRPGTGSWLSVDPIEGGLAYAYALGCPVMVADPSGLWGWGGAKRGAKRGAKIGAIGGTVAPGIGTGAAAIGGAIIGAIIGGFGDGGGDGGDGGRDGDGPGDGTFPPPPGGAGGWGGTGAAPNPSPTGPCGPIAEGAVKLRGASPNPHKRVTKEMVRDACLKYKPKSWDWCVRFAEKLRGATCGALWGWCKHLGREGGPGNEQYLKMCLSVHDHLCQAARDCEIIGGAL